MSIDEKLIAVAENQEKVFEAGKKAEYDALWDELQNYGQPKSYANAFSFYLWNDKTYNPKYPFKIANCNAMFSGNTGITDTKVPLDFRGNKGQIYYVFENAKNLVTINKIILDETNQTFSRWFNNCTSLKNITFEGTIGKNIDFQYSPLLSKASIENIVSCLSTTATGQTLTLSLTAVNNAFETSSGAADGSTSQEWINLITPKSNTYDGLWTITLV